jgi:hypothetical protein
MEFQRYRQPMHKNRAAMGKMIHPVGALAPLGNGEFVKDLEKRWPAIRICAAVTALASRMR